MNLLAGHPFDVSRQPLNHVPLPVSLGEKVIQGARGVLPVFALQDECGNHAPDGALDLRRQLNAFQGVSEIGDRGYERMTDWGEKILLHGEHLVSVAGQLSPQRESAAVDFGVPAKSVRVVHAGAYT